MKYILFLIIVFYPAYGFLAPKPSFHEGPYFMVSGGLINFSTDNNFRTGEKIGNDFEPSAGFHFGWNLKDYIGPELQVRYTTNRHSGDNSREHLLNINLNAVYSLISDRLTSFRFVKLIPIAEIGPMIQLALVPGDKESSDRTIPIWGPGVSVATGCRVIFLKYGYAGIIGQADFVNLPSKSQDINYVSSKIIKGGFSAQFGFSVMAGVHF